MRKILKIGFVALLLSVGYGPMAAQEQVIKINDFKLVPTDLTGSVRPIYDNTGEACATILFDVKDTTFVIDGNLGVMNRETKIGDIRIWIPRGTRRLTVRHEGMFPLRGYEIPIRLNSKLSYHARIGTEKDTIIPPQRKVKPKINIGIGYNMLSLSGPSLSFGLDINHHIIELSGIYGIKKTDDIYFYSSDELKAGYRYQASRGSLRYGYDIRAGIVGFMPQVGVAANLFTLEPLKEAGMKTNDFRYTYSISAIGALRLSVTIGKYMKLHVTPEYDFGVYKSNHLKLVNDYDNDLKKWTEGFGLNAGLIIMF